ncbi:LysE/ArgO family amino acid transporter [Variovorax sp. SG517]|uniref:LysE/ArgO family amino acid transporter n=1 Tax=unclassified Variovorax TaxID=663243 RepID=UPI00159EB8CC|nr:LysE/ArgO family amino acid transporter [Variovorax sp. SG517]NVM87140.1 L-lysine exporter family protein LysE/ArgO [Variovorax sp. SG517]
MQAVQVTTALANGFFMSLVLIVAIGAQNAYVLRQGLRREHVGAVVLFCAAGDAVLISAGVAGMAQALNGRPMLATVLAALGAAFLCAYGLRALWRSRQPAALQASAQGASSLSRAAVVAQAAGFTLLNPHVYLDTVLLVGSAGAQYAGMLKLWFVVGASMASVLWFTSLGFGARLLAPVFARPRAWQMLDALIGGTMLVLAAMLLRRALAGA